MTRDNWDPTNDYSRKDLPTKDIADTPYLTTYRNGVLVDGTEPDGTTPKPTGTGTPTPSKTTTTKTTKTTTKTTTTSVPPTTTTKTTKTTKTSCKGKTCTTKKTSSKKSSSCKGKTCTTKKSSSCKGKTCTTKKTTPKKTSTKKTKKQGAAAQACTADVRVVSAWAGGFAAAVTVRAASDAGADWAVRFSAPGTTVTQVVGAASTPQADGVVLTGVGGTDLLPAGSSTTFTLVGTASGPTAPEVTCG